jgi:hypothetical protein
MHIHMRMGGHEARNNELARGIDRAVRGTIVVPPDMYDTVAFEHQHAIWQQPVCAISIGNDRPAVNSASLEFGHFARYSIRDNVGGLSKRMQGSQSCMQADFGTGANSLLAGA